ncbi:MAG: M42 family metallopeptidase [Anaerolineae bacterium]
MDTLAFLRSLSQAHGVSGHEQEVREVARATFGPLADELRTDALGNLIALKRGTRAEGAPARSVMLAAHTDEIGLMVTGIERGMLRINRVGGVDVRTILGQEVLVHTEQRTLPGIIASRPPHVLSEEERQSVVPFEKLFVDVGLQAEEVERLVHIGDTMTMRRDVLELADGYVSGKSFDDRAGVVALAVCLDALQGLKHTWDVYAVATTQEEVGMRGALASAFGVAPGVALAVDVGFGAQQGVAESESIAMDGGPSLARGPNIHPVVFDALVTAAKKHEQAYQVEVAAGATGTDAWAIQMARGGVPCGLLSIPLRYMHTSVETICLRDIERTGRLMASFIAGLDEGMAAKLGLDREGIAL